VLHEVSLALIDRGDMLQSYRRRKVKMLTWHHHDAASILAAGGTF